MSARIRAHAWIKSSLGHRLKVCTFCMLDEEENSMRTNPEECPGPDNQEHKYLEFQRALTELINTHGMETPSNTPDFILSKMLTDALRNFDATQDKRSLWHISPDTDQTQFQSPTEDHSQTTTFIEYKPMENTSCPKCHSYNLSCVNDGKGSPPTPNNPEGYSTRFIGFNCNRCQHQIRFKD